MLRALEELRLGASPLVDHQTQLRLGKMIGARFMIFGGYQIIGDLLRVDIRLVDVETGKVLKAVHKLGSPPDLTGGIEAARQAAEEL